MITNPRDLVFDRVTVDHIVRGGTRVSWSLFHQFNGVPPYTFTLEVGSTGNPDAADWADASLPAVDSTYAVDDVQRDFGMNPETHYRVRLVDAAGAAYFSRPEPVYGLLSLRDWLLAREIVRKELLVGGRYAAVDGYLLKRMPRGSAPPADDPRAAYTDPLTGEVIRRAPVNAGTPFTGGYFAPMPFQVGMDPGGTYAVTDPSREGNTDPVRVTRQGRIVLLPPPSTYDVFAENGSGLRYYIHVTKHQAAVRGVPIVASCEFRQAPFTDVAYDVAVP